MRGAGGIVLAISAVSVVSAMALTGCAAGTGDAPSASIPIEVSEQGPPGDVVALPADLSAMLDRAIADLPGIAGEALERTGVPGMAVAVVAGGETVFAEGYGTKIAGEDDPVGPETVFQIASVSKSLTGTIIAKAVSDGLLEWTTPVHELLPELEFADPYVTEHATIADLMSHGSGLPTGGGDDLEMLGYDRAYILDRIGLLPLAPFRAEYHYSNFGITIAGEATATAAGTDWEQLAQTSLFEPLGMTSTSARYDDFLARADRATINALLDGEFAPGLPRDPDPEAPAGGVSSNVLDLAEWMKLVLADGEHGDEQLIAAEDLIPAITGQRVSAPARDPQLRGGEYGYGFNVTVADGGRPIVSHSGAFILGTGTNYRLLPGLDVGIIVLTNGSAVGAAEAVASAFTDELLYGAVTRDWVAAYEAVFAQYYLPGGDLAGQEPPADAAAPAAAAEYAGTYTNPYFGELLVEAGADGGLVARAGPGGDYLIELSPWDGDVFAFDLYGEEAADGTRSSADFQRTDGAVTSVRLDWFDRFGLGEFVRAG